MKTLLFFLLALMAVFAALIGFGLFTVLQIAAACGLSIFFFLSFLVIRWLTRGGSR